jgi:HicB family
MELTPYLETLRRELSAAAAPGGPDATRVADLLSGSIDAAARLCLLEALSDATAEITSKLETASVEVRLRGRDADFVVTELAEPAQPAPATEPPADGGDLTRITLRLPEPLKAQVDRAAATEGISVNAWLVRAVATAVGGRPPTPPGGQRGGRGRRVVGFAQA